MPLFASISPSLWAILLFAGWILLAIISHKLLDNPRENIEGGLAYWLSRLYARVVHRLRVTGREHLPTERAPGPLIVVANHTSGVDPVLIQVVTPFEIRFMMARDMQPKWLEPFWNWTGVIGVDRFAPRGDTAAAREAIRFLQTTGKLDSRGNRNSGVVGIFPEGSIEIPRRRLLPFLPGIGLLVHKTGARVLPVVIDGTPECSSAWGSLFRTSRSTVRFLPLMSYEESKLRPNEIAEDLHSLFAREAGWSN